MRTLMVVMLISIVSESSSMDWSVSLPGKETVQKYAPLALLPAAGLGYAAGKYNLFDNWREKGPWVVGAGFGGLAGYGVGRHVEYPYMAAAVGLILGGFLGKYGYSVYQKHKNEQAHQATMADREREREDEKRRREEENEEKVNTYIENLNYENLHQTLINPRNLHYTTRAGTPHKVEENFVKYGNLNNKNLNVMLNFFIHKRFLISLPQRSYYALTPNNKLNKSAIMAKLTSYFLDDKKMLEKYVAERQQNKFQEETEWINGGLNILNEVFAPSDVTILLDDSQQNLGLSAKRAMKTKN